MRILGKGLAAEQCLLTNAQVARTRDFIRDNVAADLSLTVLARIAGVSPPHFATAFRGSLGVAPHRYVLGERIAAARRLLVLATTHRCH